MSYCRVLPRDLFNEAKLLKCMGRLILKIEDGQAPTGLAFEHDHGLGGPFIVRQDSGDGRLYVANIDVFVGRAQVNLSTPYNCKEAWPLIVTTADDSHEVEVFDEAGGFAREFEEFCKNIKEREE